MQPPTSPQLHAESVHRVPAFTVATALAWLGHDDCRTCPEQVHERANAWLIGSPPGPRQPGMRAVINIEFVDAPWSRADGNRIVAQINVCTRRDRIQVCQRTDLDRSATAAMGDWLSLVAEQ